MIYQLEEREKASDLFGDWQESLIWSCLQGVMGNIYVDNIQHPTSAMAILGDFAYYAGEPKEEVVAYKPKNYKKDFVIMMPQNNAWGKEIEKYYEDRASKITRYAIKKEMAKDFFDVNRLEKMVKSKPEEYELVMMDKELFHRCKQIPWCVEWVDCYDDFEMYRRYGLGAILLKNGQPVSGASSYTSFRQGIEIEIITRQDHQQKGLATICAAKLILECIKKDWYPSWDARTKISVALAEKLGYHFSHEYDAYDIRGY